MQAARLANGLRQTDLSVRRSLRRLHPGDRAALGKLDGVEYARVNLSTKRVSVRWRDDRFRRSSPTLERLGYRASVRRADRRARTRRFPSWSGRVAVAGFAAGNIMLLSVSVWSGAEGATRDLFHWVSALIAIPALVFAGRIFFRSAWSALSHGRMNMDVPIALGVSLAYAMSLYETINHGEHAYFDAAVSLLFFLLIGRTLDHVMRERARAAVNGLARLAPRGAMVMRRRTARVISAGRRDRARACGLLLAAGERMPVDACIVEGSSDLDCSLVTGESAPRSGGVRKKPFAPARST